MKKLLMVAITLIVSSSMYAQKFISKKQHINTVNNQYIETNNNIFFTIEGDKVLITNKKGDNVFEEIKIGETKKGDLIIKHSINEASEGSTGKKELVRRSKDTFTDKSSKIIYELTEILE